MAEACPPATRNQPRSLIGPEELGTLSVGGLRHGPLSGQERTAAARWLAGAGQDMPGNG
jgi:hypothetical protein